MNWGNQTLVSFEMTLNFELFEFDMDWFVKQMKLWYDRKILN